MTATQTLGLTASGRRAVTFTAFAVGSVSHFTFLITILYAEDNQYRRGIRSIGSRVRQSRTIVVAYCPCPAQAHLIDLRLPKEKNHET